jgi:hypothetical protein
MKYCGCGFFGVEIHFLRLDGGKGLASDCRACQQNRLGIDPTPRPVGTKLEPMPPRSCLCFWCLTSGATVNVQTNVGPAPAHSKCIPEIKQFLDGYVS